MPLFYNPSRDSRHRRACLALYRALMRQTRRIDLPDELRPAAGFFHPLKYTIRISFRRNKLDTSIRLVTSALTRGYEALNLLHVAGSDATSAEYARLITFLHTRYPVAIPASASPRPPRDPSKTSFNTPKLLTRVPKESGGRHGLDYEYISTTRPLPLSSLSGGVRKVPVLESARGIPFLRIGKPSSPRLGNYLRHKLKKDQSRGMLVQELRDEDTPNAQIEDAWDGLMKELGRAEAVGVERDARHDQQVSFKQGVQLSIKYLEGKYREGRLDMIARARAMTDIVKKEKALAEREKEDRQRDKEARPASRRAPV